MDLLLFFLIMFLQEDAYKPNAWEAGGVIGGIIMALGVLIKAFSWIGDYYKDNKSAKLNYDLKSKELENANEDKKILQLENRIDELLQKTRNLEATLEEREKYFQNLIETERQASQNFKQQLSSINVAFDMVYISLEETVGKSESGQKLLEKLRLYIKGGNGNLTSSP